MNGIAGSFHTDGQDFGGYNDCTWRIEVPTSYRRIELIVFYFNDDDVQLAECRAGCVQVRPISICSSPCQVYAM